MEKIRGLNLGGWLVLEKWMTPELYDSYNAEDEFNLIKVIPKPELMLKKHRDTFITENDFQWIKEHGINTVRIPVGHWLFKADYPYFEAKDYVDKAFIWAKKYDLSVVLDVHAAKGCQNGFDNGGLSGIIDWHKDKKNIAETLEFISELCDNYGKEEMLSGIELLNEPHISIDLELIQDFYLKGYKIVRNKLGNNISVIFHDAFRLNQWEEFFKSNNFFNVYLDTHMYQVFGEVNREANIFDITKFVIEKRLEVIKKIRDLVPIIIGEWSVGMSPTTLSYAKDEIQKNSYHQLLANALLLAYEEADGWFFWNYKLSDQSTIKNFGWSFRNMVEKNILPFKKKGN
jgi:glucan 1,3-beta-glucosidase